MTLTQMQFALAVARKKSFSGAAESCRVSQPSLSVAVRKLERELGGPLFVRTTRRVELTPLGEQSLPLFEDVMETVERLQSIGDASRRPQRPLIRMGISPLVSSSLLGNVLRPFQRRHPAVQVVIKQCFLDGLQERLAGHTLDVVIAPVGHLQRKFARRPFYTDTLQFIAADRAAGRAAGRAGSAAGMSVKEIAQETFVLTGDGCGLTPFVRKLFRKEGLRLNEYPGTALTHQVIEEWADLGLGAGLLPKLKLTTAKPRACPVLRRGKPIPVHFEIVWHPRSEAGAHVTALLRHFEQAVPKLVESIGH
jgi:DNA-binding transcriptional LysR family regulator